MVSFEPRGRGLGIVDPIERRRFRLELDRPADPDPASPDAFRFPVDAAVAVAASSLAVEGIAHAYVRRGDGEMVAQLGPDSAVDLPADDYELELDGPVKCYLRTDGALSARIRDDRLELAVDGEVLIGARSYHEHPAGTITLSPTPEDALRAVSYLGSALKTTSPERSYPTLRGHPPTVEVGDSFSVPDGISTPDTGVEIVAPPTYRAACVVAPLAFYLGATLRPGDRPRIRADGRTFALDDPDLETGVERALKRSWFLDCLVRTEGYYPVDLRERAAVEPRLELDLADLYDRPLDARVAAALSVPFDRVADSIPQWTLAAYVDPSPAGVEALPFVVGDLALVRPAEGETVSAAEVRSSLLDDFMAERTRSGDGGADEGGTDGTADPTDPTLVRAPPVDAVERAWFGEGVPVNASRALPAAFRNDLDRRPDAGDIAIAVVSNDPDLRAENDAVRAVYGSRSDLPFDVTVRRDLTRAQLRAVLASGADFLHYVGHVDDEGFECADGRLDARGLDSTDVGAFLLNACRSYEQGRELVEAGSVGGVVTLGDVVDSGAVRIGEAMARLLNLGFPLRAALDIARSRSVVGGHYTVVGDGRVSVVQEEGGLSMLCVVEETKDTRNDEGAGDAEDGGEETYDLTIRAYPPREGGMGTLARPTVTDDDRYSLAPGPIGPFRLSADRLREYLDRHRYPVKKGGGLHWNADALDL